MFRNCLNEGVFFLIRLEVENAQKRSGLTTFHRSVFSFSRLSFFVSFSMTKTVVSKQPCFKFFDTNHIAKSVLLTS